MDIVNAVLKLYEAGPELWEHAIKEGPMGNLDQQFEDWSHRQGYDPPTPEILADFLFVNWLALSILCVVTAGLIAECGCSSTRLGVVRSVGFQGIHINRSGY